MVQALKIDTGILNFILLMPLLIKLIFLFKLKIAFVSQFSQNLQHQIDNFYNFAEMQMSV